MKGNHLPEHTGNVQGCFFNTLGTIYLHLSIYDLNRSAQVNLHAEETEKGTSHKHTYFLMASC